MTERPLLVVMAKAPVCGAAKTRLAASIGHVAATALYRQLTARLLRSVRRDPRWSLALAITPPAALSSAHTCWSGAFLRLAQGTGDLGQRMQRLFDRFGQGPLLLVGSDAPGITSKRIAAAFRLLRASDAVFGPAEDGGYWLVGLRRRPRTPQIFERVRWSSEHTLDDTLLNMKGLRVALAATLYDIDGAKDYRRYLAETRDG